MKKSFLKVCDKSNNKNTFFENNSILSFKDICESHNVVICGGEPTLFSGFFNLISKLSGCRSISVITNARAFSYSWFSRKIDGNSFNAYVEILSYDESRHDSLTGTPGSFKQTIEGARNLLDSSIQLNFVMPFIGQDKNEIILTKKLAHDLGAKRFVIKNCTNRNYPPFFFKELSDDFPFDIEAIDFEDFNLPSKMKLCFEIQDLNLITGSTRIKLLRIIRDLIYPVPFSNPDDLYNCFHNINESILDSSEKTGLGIESIYDINSLVKREGLVQLPQPPCIGKLPGPESDNNPNLCQLSLNKEHLMHRLNYLLKIMVPGSDLVLLGDEDNISIELAKTGHFKSITVFEYDSDTVKELKKKGKDYPIFVYEHDLRKKIPCKFNGVFAYMYCAPPHNPEGFRLFVSRGVKLLRGVFAKKAFVSFDMSFLDKAHEIKINKIINEMGLLSKNIGLECVPEFPKYLHRRYSDPKYLRGAITDPFHINKNDLWHLSKTGRAESCFELIVPTDCKPAVESDIHENVCYDEDIFEKLSYLE
ncbi:MAG: bis-aminopropyl spermidine synthase family protein [Nanobdellota archaeon]